MTGFLLYFPDKQISYFIIRLKNKEKVNEVLNIDKSRYELVAVIAVGYKDENPVSEREELDKLILQR